MDWSSISAESRVADLDGDILRDIAGFLGVTDTERNWLALTNEMSHFLDSDAIDSLYTAAMHRSDQAAAEGLMEILRTGEVRRLDLANALKNIQNWNALSQLFPQVPPEIKDHPLGGNVPAKTRITLKCDVSGNPPPLCQWWRRNEDNEDWISVGEAGQSELIIKSFHVLDEGQYCCVATNSTGQVWSNIAVVCLDPRECDPRFVDEPETLQFCVVGGLQPLCLNCEAVAIPPPRYQWYYNNQPLMPERGPVLRVDFGGVYYCVASNSLGTTRTKDIQVLLVRKEAPSSIKERGAKHLEEYYREHKLILTAPSEILAMGPLAQKAYLKALADGDISYRRFLLMLVGKDRAGKTSLVKALLGEPVDPEHIEDSTSGIDVRLVWCKRDGEKCTFHKLDDLADELKTIKRLQARYLAEKLQEKETKATELKAATLLGVSYESGVKRTFQGRHTTEVSQFPDPSSFPMSEDLSLSATADGCVSVSQEGNNSAASSVHTSQSSGSDQQDSHLSLLTDDILTDEMKLLVKEELQKLAEYEETEGNSCDNKCTDSRVESDCLWLRIYDFAGQPIYYNSHSSFMVDRGIYLIVHNLEDDPNTRAVVQVGRSSQNYLIPQETCYTNLEYIKTWATAVSATCSVLTKKSPVYLLVGTHYDKIRKKFRYTGERMQFLSAREQLIRHEIGLRPLSLHFREPFFYVDSTQSHYEDKTELDALRTRIVELAENDEQDDECMLSSEVSLPYSWLRFEVELYQEAAVNLNPYLLYDEAVKRACHCLGKRYPVNEIANQCKSMLEFYDRLGVVMWFQSEALKNYILIDPQRVLNLFKRVISLEPHFSIQQTVRDFWEKLRRNGVIEQQDLNSMLDDALAKENELMVERRKKMGLTTEMTTVSDNLDQRKEFLFLMLQKFYLLAPYVTKSESFNHGCYSRLLIPSLITWEPPLDTFCNHPLDAPNILLSSSHHTVPDALFNRLVACCICRYPLCPQVHRYFARLHVDKYHDLLLFNWKVESENESGKIKLVMHRLDGNSQMTDPKLCSQALRYVVDSIAEVRNQRMYGLQFTLQAEILQDYDETVTAPVFSGSCKHQQMSCAEVECIDHIAQHLGRNVENGEVKKRSHDGCKERVIDVFAQRLWFCEWKYQEKDNYVPVVRECNMQPDYVDTNIQVAYDCEFTEKKNEQHYKVQSNSKLCLSCPLEECGCTYEYQWFRAGAPLLDENRQFYSISCFERKAHSGIYTCKVTHMGKTRYYGPLLLQVKPKRDHKLCLSIEAGVDTFVRGKPIQRRQSVSLGHCVMLKVEIEPSDMAKREGLELKYQWHQNGKAIPNATNTELRIDHVQDFHDGIYHCQISEEGAGKDDDSAECSSSIKLHMASPDWQEDPTWKDRARIYREKQRRVDSCKGDQQAVDKVALLIGNCNYEKMDRLQYPETDVVQIGSLLKQLGFKVLTFVNLNFFDMGHVLRIFYGMIHKGVYALLYFAGHGVEYHNETYILPTDGDDKRQPTVGFRERAIEYEMQMREARLSVLLLDCCRVRPHRWSNSRCSLPSLGIGTLITHYSCCSMQPAYEPNTGQQSDTRSGSIYARQLMRSLENLIKSDSYQSVQDLLTEVNEEVGKQKEGFSNMVWQVPQRRDHIAEHLSLAQKIDARSKVAQENSQLITEVYSRIDSVDENIDHFHLELHCERWLCNVLLVGARVLDNDDSDVEINLQFDDKDEIGLEYTALDKDGCNIVHRTLENNEAMVVLKACRHFMKVSNVQLATSNILPIKLTIPGIGVKNFYFNISSGCDFTRSSYQHGQKIKGCSIDCCYHPRYV